MTSTTSLPLAKELWELGLKIETEKWWVSCDEFNRNWNISNSKVGWKEPIPAPQTDELLAVLPARMAGVGLLKIYKLEDEYDVTYASIYSQTHSILCEALGLMCKYLLTHEYEFNGKEIMRKGEK